MHLNSKVANPRWSTRRQRRLVRPLADAADPHARAGPGADEAYAARGQWLWTPFFSGLLHRCARPFTSHVRTFMPSIAAWGSWQLVPVWCSCCPDL